MKEWRVSVVDGHLRRYAGFAVALADKADEARDAVIEYLKNDTAFRKPYEVSQVEPHDEPQPYVVFMNWGDWDEWPPEHETSFPTE
jgi:hypothetical protein